MSKVLLVILDGWGCVGKQEHNAIKLAKTPNYNALTSRHPACLLNASGLAVGLPEGQMGNSEVGHVTIGAGRAILQELPRINQAFTSGEIKYNPALLNLLEKQEKGICHLLGLISDGGVHSHISHIIGLSKLLRFHNIEVKVHAIADGRDVAPKSVLKYLQMISDEGIEVASISGRFYAMDRDKRWERSQKAYEAIVSAAAPKFSNLAGFVADSYASGISDEFLVPHSFEAFSGIKDGDSIIFANFRADRMRQIAASIVDPGFSEFERHVPRLSKALMMSSYSERLEQFMQTIFAQEIPGNTLSEVVSANHLRQIKIAETEKYAHVTYFFNGGREQPFEGEHRVLIQSPKVSTYDLQPEMSAAGVADAVIRAIGEGYDLIVVNFANADMVGHSGILAAAIKAVESVDVALGRIMAALEKTGYDMLLTADHGNAEEMLDTKTGQPLTSHTLNPVPFLYYGNKDVIPSPGGHTLADIAPTILRLLGLATPGDMEGSPIVL